MRVVFYSVIASLFFFDFLDHILLGNDTLAIWRDFLAHGPATTGRYVNQRHTYATSFPCQKLKQPVGYTNIILPSVLSHSP